MNLLDLALGLLLLSAIVGGLRVGLVARVLTWIGLGAGALASTFTVPLVLRVLETGSPTVRFVAGLTVLAMTVTVCMGVFQSVGSHLREGVAASPLSGVDRVLGAIAGGGMVFVVLWLLLPAASETTGGVAQQVRGSTLIAAIDTLAPDQPALAHDLRALVGASRFPAVFDDLRPSPETSPPPDQIPVDRSIVAQATASTVQVQSRGCGRRYDGSGVTIATDTVITNAHVVAGADSVEVHRPDGTVRAARVVRFDPDRDLAVLEVPDLGQTALSLGPADIPGDGVSIGYPGGQREPRVAPLRIDDRRTATGRDIYGNPGRDRSVLFLAAELRQGDSGSPVIDTAGR